MLSALILIFFLKIIFKELIKLICSDPNLSKKLFSISLITGIALFNNDIASDVNLMFFYLLSKSIFFIISFFLFNDFNIILTTELSTPENCDKSV